MRLLPWFLMLCDLGAGVFVSLNYVFCCFFLSLGGSVGLKHPSNLCCDFIIFVIRSKTLKPQTDVFPYESTKNKMTIKI